MNRINFFKISVVVIFLLIVLLIFLKVTKKDNNVEKEVATTTNYVENADGTKTNNSEMVKSEQNFDGINVKGIDLTYSNSNTTLITNVTNTTIEAKNISLKIFFYDESGNLLGESFGYVGKIAPNETRQINSAITTDVSNTKNIKYEIVK